MNFMMEFAITKILFTEHVCARIVLLCRHVVTKIISTKFSFYQFRAIHEIFVL